MSETIILAGDGVMLRTTIAGDFEALIATRRTPEVMRWWRGDDLAVEMIADLEDDETHQLSIRLPDDRIIGLIQFWEEPDPEYRHASIDIYIDPAHHRRGLATDAIVTLCRYLFDERGHHRLVIDPSVDNRGAIACYRRIGFRPVGVMRCYERRADGTFGDGLLMDMLSTEMPSVDQASFEP